MRFARVHNLSGARSCETLLLMVHGFALHLPHSGCYVQGGVDCSYARPSIDHIGAYWRYCIAPRICTAGTKLKVRLVVVRSR